MAGRVDLETGIKTSVLHFGRDLDLDGLGLRQSSRQGRILGFG